MQSANYLKISSFFIKRIIEIIGLLTVLLSFFLLLSLSTYTPEDPNFIFSENTKIQNLFGFYGSVISDLILQSFGIISFLFCVTIFLTGILIIRYKKLKNILSNLFYSIIYIFSGSTVTSIYKDDSFWLIVNGNGGFVGRNIKEFIYSFNGSVNQNIIFFLLLSLTIIFFLLSIQFSIKSFFRLIKSVLFFVMKFFSSKLKQNNFNSEVEINLEKKINESIKTETTQSNLPFKNVEKNFNTKKFKLPPIEYLKKPSKNDLKFESDYNTYLHHGLPIGPISNPGKDSIEATTNPLKNNLLYFVADGFGGHLFSDNYDEHLSNIKKVKKSK
mgnify:CR=1 FL=1